jgi:hypothetical protein
MTLRELAQEAGLSNYRGVGTVIKNFERWLNDNPTIRGAARATVKLMTGDPGNLRMTPETSNAQKTTRPNCGLNGQRPLLV